MGIHDGNIMFGQIGQRGKRTNNKQIEVFIYFTKNSLKIYPRHRILDVILLNCMEPGVNSDVIRTLFISLKTDVIFLKMVKTILFFIV